MTTVSYWRSLGDLEGSSDEAVEFREREFSEGASEPPVGITRRQILTLMGASASLAGLAACRRPKEHIVPYVDAPEQIIPGVARRYATTMPAGTSAYGLVVENHEGRPTKIEGNELHPASLGSSSARVQAAILDLYDPDRSPAVVKGGQPSSWAEFVEACKERVKVHVGDGGAGLALLMPPSASPTLSRWVAAFRQTYPQAQVVIQGPVTDRNVFEGLTRATGRPLLAVHRFDKARSVLAVDSDFLHDDAEMIRNTRGFAASRRIAKAEDSMNRLWAVEAAYSVTGANADHRLRVRARSIPSFVAGLASELGVSGGAPAGAGIDAAWLKAVAADLRAHKGASLVVAGPRQPASVHAAVYTINAALGNVGATVEYHEPADALLPAAGLTDLVASLNQSRVKTLVIAGGNPAYDAPGDIDFATAARKAEVVIHLGLHRDETAEVATWHVPQAHFLEAWDDARASCGTLSVVQPMILPLFGGKTATELIHVLTSGEDKPAYNLVRETWRPLLGEADFEKRWRRVLHDGLLADSATPAVTPAASSAASTLSEEAAALEKATGDLDLVFAACPKVHDGSAANNPWLQELPDAITKITWDNPLLISPATAAAKGLTDGNVVQLSTGGERPLELLVFRVPGMADGTAIATLGYGRWKAGRAGNGVGVRTYALRPSAGPDLVTGVLVTRTGRTEILAQTQEHGSMDGRSIVREATLDHYRKDPKFAADHHQLFSLWKEHEYKSRPQWGMVIDLSSCTGCNACVIACQSENNIPVVGKDQVRRGREMHWIRVDRYYSGDPADPKATFQPVPCMQCENAPCEQVCPVAATVHDAEGLNAMVYNRCIGTRYCSNNCPYKVRHFNFFNYTKDTPEIMKMANNPDVTVRARGVMEKCTYCIQRINAAKIDARLDGRELKDGDVKTACQQACPAQAIHFGDILDSESAVAKARATDRNYSLLAELNTKPRTTYLARIRNPEPALEPAAVPKTEGNG